LVENISEVVEKASGAGREPFVVVGIPAFNEEKTIAKVIIEAQEYASEVVVCDDGSTDCTAKIAERLGANVIRHKENLGYGAAIKSLFKFAKDSNADILVTLDADGQHDPAEVPNVLTPIVNDAADIVIGSRFVDKRLAYTIPWYRRAGIRFITRLANNTPTHGVSDAQSGFRAYNRRSLEFLDMFENGMGVSVEILMDAKKQGLRICEVPSSCSYEKDLRASTHNPARHGTDVAMCIIKLLVEDKPLQMLGVPGIICLVVGTIFGVWMLQLYAIEHQITTNIALASIAFILIGFFCLSTAITLYAISRLAEKMNKK
jgi:glycosyltransferase involved in cell wall biosynthesis